MFYEDSKSKLSPSFLVALCIDLHLLEIGIGLILIGIIIYIMGVIFFLDRALLVIGNVSYHTILIELSYPS